MSYSETFKAKMVEKMLGGDTVSIAQLSERSGVSQSGLYRWRQLAIVGGMGSGNKRAEDSTKSPVPRRPQDWSPEERLEVVARATRLSDEELGAFLRREGLQEACLDGWRRSMLEAVDVPAERRRNKRNAVQSRRIKELERELGRKDKALAETAALLVLKKKAQAIWGDEDDGIS